MQGRTAPRRVLKLGGSLLTLDDWPDCLRQWRDAQTPADDLLVVGGGRLADVVREMDSHQRIDDAEAHWMCVAAMAINASRVAEVLDAAMATATEILSSRPQARLRVIDSWHFMREEDATFAGDPLPVGWHVTSDSIAARVARVVEAKTLVLFKSCLPADHEPAAMAEAGYVDAYFPRASAEIQHIQCVDLRSASRATRPKSREVAGG